jgi:Holliday junction DNA helicase RuvA
MIAKLRGKLVEKHPGFIILDVNNIFFEISISLNCYSSLPDINTEIIILTQTVVREDGIYFYGFLSSEEKRLFMLLNTVSKIGPKLALSILSMGDIKKLKSAILNKDVNFIAMAPGVGKKTAERIVLELRDKIDDVVPAEQVCSVEDDLISALVNLGYKKADALTAIKKVGDNYKTFEEKLRESLKILNNF